MVKQRRHHNNTGLAQIKQGLTRRQVEQIARKLNIPTSRNTDFHYVRLARRL